MHHRVASLNLEATKSRLNILRMLRASGSGHAGGALSAIDIITALYFAQLRVHPSSPDADDRDRFLLSAGHKAMAQYAVLARRGFFPESLLDTYAELGSQLGGHPDMHTLPGIEANTGALGHGLAIACGMAQGLKMDNTGGRVYAVLGDGELPEGSNWEGASIASHFDLDNLCIFVDVNGMQISGTTAEVMSMEPIADKFEAFGWDTLTIDGHSFPEILGAFAAFPVQKGRPTAVIARTIKGKGVPAIEGLLGSHYWKPAPDELDAAEKELNQQASHYLNTGEHV